MERSGNFYKAIRLGYILISILIGCMVKMFGQGNIRRWREKGLVEPVSKRPGKIEYRVSDLRILQQRKQDLLSVTCSLCVRMKTLIMWGGISTNVLKAKDSLVKRQPDCWIIFSERRAHGVSMDLWKMTISAPNAYANVLVCAAKDVSKSL